MLSSGTKGFLMNMQRYSIWFVPALVALLVALCPPSAHAQHLRQTSFADGTGSVGLPPGWKIVEGYHGTVFCAKQSDMYARFGMPWTVDRPDSPVSRIPAPYKLAIAPIGDLPDAVRAVLGTVGARLVSLRSRPAPQTFPGVPASYFLYRFVQGGKEYTALGYFTTINPGGDSPYWSLYSSAVSARTPLFMKSLPMLMAMWNSWRPNGQTPRAGSQSAVIDEEIKHSKDSFAKLNEKFDQHIRN